MSTTHISIEVTSGNSFVKSDDISRAGEAAENYFSEKDIDAMEAQSEYVRQWAELDSEDGMTGLALDWIAARQAADIALTQGWASPDGASCDIEAWRK